MNKYQIDIQVKNKLGFPFKRERIRNIAKLALSSVVIRQYIQLGIVYTDDRVTRNLNKKYRGIDLATDVLSFSLLSDIKTLFNSKVKPSPDKRIQLGEIIISYPMAVKQAHEQGRPVEEETALLLVHGILHLLGYDHTQAADAHRMEAKEKAIIRMIDFDRKQLWTIP